MAGRGTLGGEGVICRGDLRIAKPNGLFSVLKLLEA